MSSKGEKKLRVVCLSDTHALHANMEYPIPDGDILIHAGDLSARGALEDIRSFNEWLGTLPHEHKVVIAGNHDFCFEREREEAQGLLTNCTYLQDSSIVLRGLKIYGSPWQPWFFDWAFNLERGEPLATVWRKIPDDTDILITHGPPFGVLDTTHTGEHVGCEELLKRVHELSLRMHVFGHIHEAYGVMHKSGTAFVNASSCTLEYRPVNAPIVIEL